MERDSYPRFLRSDIYRGLLESLAADTTNGWKCSQEGERKDVKKKPYNWNVWAPSRGRTDKREEVGRVSHLQHSSTNTGLAPQHYHHQHHPVQKQATHLRAEAGSSQRDSGLVGSVCTGWDVWETEGLRHWMNQQDGALLLWLLSCVSKTFNGRPLAFYSEMFPLQIKKKKKKKQRMYDAMPDFSLFFSVCVCMNKIQN